ECRYIRRCDLFGPLDEHGSGSRARSTAKAFRWFPDRCQTAGPGSETCQSHALPSRSSWRRDQRGRNGRAAEYCLPTGWQSHARPESLAKMATDMHLLRPAVVLLSGGLDSATVLAVAQRDGFRCHALPIDYGQRHAVELAAAARVAAAAGVVEHR